MQVSHAGGVMMFFHLYTFLIIQAGEDDAEIQSVHECPTSRRIRWDYRFDSASKPTSIRDSRQRSGASRANKFAEDAKEQPTS